MSLPSIDAAQSGFLAALTTAALWGLAGGFSHCIGMCGIFVLSCEPFDKANRQKSAARRILFHLGRTASLVSLGAAAGAIGSLAGLAAHTARAQGLIAVVFGLVLALLALGYVGFIPWLRIPEPDILAAGGGAGRRLFGAVLRGRQSYQPLLLGMMVGLLPCGLTYSILIPAGLTLNAMSGALVLLAFALGTIPGLLTFAVVGDLAGRKLSEARFRILMTRSGAVVMFVMGIVMIARGWPVLLTFK